MCQLMAICDNEETTPKFSFKELKIRGGGKGPHRDGWGIGFYEKKNATIYKEPEPAFASDLAKQIEDGKIQLKSKIFVAHIRWASSGIKSMGNTHPFKKELFGKEWIFAHNGTLKGIFEKDIGNFKTEGQTDSERAFCYILNKLKNKCREDSSIKEISKIISETAEYISEMGNFNFIMSDSEHLFCFGHNSLHYTKRQFGNNAITLEDSDYQINVSDMKKIGEKAIIVATQPLTKEEKWEKITGLMVFKDGKKVFG